MAEALKIRPEAAEVVSAEARAVLAMVQDEERRGRLADLIAAVEDGEVASDDAQALEEVLELGLQSGRLRAVYGPEGEQAALTLYRRLPRGRELGEAAREGADVLGVGGGSVGLEKARGLLDAGARVTVVSPLVVPELEDLPVELVRRPFEETDVLGRRLVIATTSVQEVNVCVSAAAET